MNRAKPTFKGTLIALSLVLLVLLLVALSAFFLWAQSGSEGPPMFDSANAPRAESPDALRIMSFNIGYGRGPAGDESGPWPRSEFIDNLDGIAASIRDNRIDIAFLQEVDFESARSHDLDQADYLRAHTDLQAKSCVTTWERRYIPYPYWPPSKHYGRMKSGQCVLSRFALDSHTAYPLEKPRSNPWWKNAFYLTRTHQHVTWTLNGERHHLINVHLEAFDVANRMNHMRQLIQIIDAIPEAERARLIVAGDFNAPPPNAIKKHGFTDEPEADFRQDRTLALFLERDDLREVLPNDDAFTFPADAPTRRLDYIFYGAAYALDQASVGTPPPGPHSDHLPIFATLRPQN